MPMFFSVGAGDQTHRSPGPLLVYLSPLGGITGAQSST